MFNQESDVSSAVAVQVRSNINIKPSGLEVAAAAPVGDDDLDSGFVIIDDAPDKPANASAAPEEPKAAAADQSEIREGRKFFAGATALTSVSVFAIGGMCAGVLSAVEDPSEALQGSLGAISTVLFAGGAALMGYAVAQLHQAGYNCH
ncbi:MAG TPA: hypothetical protein VH328_03435 [Burkholderiaceae bacterium]|nr:hypothetical protein [Burkholderiaceae bacterium]